MQPNYNTDRSYWNHPAFGTIRVSASRGGAITCFGSELKHSHHVTMEIKGGVLHERYSEEVIHPSGQILTIVMTPDQWAQLVSNMGSANPVPVTIRNKDGVSMPPIEWPQERQHPCAREASRNLKQVLGNVQKALDLLESKRLSKDDINNLKSLLGKLPRAASDLEFIEDMFLEFMENQTTKAKIDIESFIAREHRMSRDPELPAYTGPGAVPAPVYD